jgi:cell division protein FtsW (lipid II flippase)
MLIAAILASAAAWAALAARIIREPGNHVAVEPLLALVPFLLLMVVVWLPRYRTRRNLRTGVTAFALSSVVLVVAMDRTNVLVQYDRWTQRGMPERPCGAVARHLWSCGP